MSLGRLLDVAVIGGGPAGYIAAIRAAQLGLKVLCVEKRGSLGGTCLNVGCIPSKALLNITHKFHEAHNHFNRWGINFVDLPKLDLTQMMAHKYSVVNNLTSGIEGLFKANGVHYMKGEAIMLEPTKIAIVGGEQFNAKNIIIATGSEPATLPNIQDIDEEIIVSSTGALNIKRVPEKMVVIGAGVIGLELGSVYARLGTQVIVVEYGNRICPSLDNEMGDMLKKSLVRNLEFIFKLSSEVTEIKKNNGSATVVIKDRNNNKEEIINCDRVLLAAGRKPVVPESVVKTLELSLEKGRIPLIDDKTMRVKENVFAIGDCIRGPMLAHKAEEEGIAVAEYLAKGTPIEINYSAIPSVVYTHPELAGVGMTEQDVKKAKIPYIKGTFPMAANSRARANDTTEGMVKILAEKDSKKLLGAWVFNDQAGEMIHELAIGVEYGASAEDVGRVCHAHPTLSEAIKEACLATYDRPLHIAKR